MFMLRVIKLVQKSDFINEIKQRGFVYQATDIDELEKIMSKNSLDDENETVYINLIKILLH